VQRQCGEHSTQRIRDKDEGEGEGEEEEEVEGDESKAERRIGGFLWIHTHEGELRHGVIPHLHDGKSFVTIGWRPERS
jgi:hypothetical protein